jgi:hypothetical protein
MTAVAPVLGGQEAASEDDVAAAAELVRAAGALLQALARSDAGRDALRDAGGVAALDALLAAAPHEEEMQEVLGALRRRVNGEAGDAPALTDEEWREGKKPRGADVGTYLAVKNGGAKGAAAQPGPRAGSGAVPKQQAGGKSHEVITATYLY